MKSWIATPLALLMLCLLLPAPGQAGERLSYSCFFPPTHDQAKLAEKWCREVKARTNGEVTVDFYPGGTLTSAKECYDGVAQGISDIGFSVLGYTRGRFPVMAAVDLPMGYRSGREATEVANSVYKRFRPDEFNDVHVLYFHAHGPGILHTADKPVKTLEDLKGMKIRATGNSGKLIGALGGTPVAMSMPDSYQSIRKGIVDGGIYPVETNKGWKMAEVVDYMTESYPVAYTTTFFVVMNKDRWNSLSEEAQKAITEISAEWIPKHGRVWDESDKAGREYFLDQGGQIIPLPTRQADRWKERAQSLVDAYVREVGSKGLNGKEIVEFTRQSLSDARK